MLYKTQAGYIFVGIVKLQDLFSRVNTCFVSGIKYPRKKDCLVSTLSFCLQPDVMFTVLGVKTSAVSEFITLLYHKGIHRKPSVDGM